MNAIRNLRNSNNNSNVTKIEVSATKHLDVAVIVYRSAIHTRYATGLDEQGKTRYMDTYGEPSLIHVYSPFYKKGITKVTSLRFANDDRATEIRATLGAAENCVTRYQEKDLEASVDLRNRILAGIEVSIEELDAINKPNWDLLQPVAGVDGEYVFGVREDGTIISGLHLATEYSTRKGDSEIGVIDTSTWGASGWLDLTIPYTTAAGEKLYATSTFAPLQRPALPGFYELHVKRGELYIQEMSDHRNEDISYRRAYHARLSDLAQGESFTMRTHTYLSKRTGLPNNWVNSKARQLIGDHGENPTYKGRVHMTHDEIVADKLRIMKAIWEKRDEKTQLATARAAGSAPKLETETDQTTGEIVERLEKPACLKINGKDVEFRTIGDLRMYFGEYYLQTPLRGGERKPVYLSARTHLDTVAMWANKGNQGFELVSRNNSMAI